MRIELFEKQQLTLISRRKPEEKPPLYKLRERIMSQWVGERWRKDFRGGWCTLQDTLPFSRVGLNTILLKREENLAVMAGKSMLV